MSLFGKDILKDSFPNGEDQTDYSHSQYSNYHSTDGALNADQNGYNNFGYSGHAIGQLNQSRQAAPQNTMFRSNNPASTSTATATTGSLQDTNVHFVNSLQTPPRAFSAPIGPGGVVTSSGGGILGGVRSGAAATAAVGFNSLAVGGDNAGAGPRSLLSNAAMQGLDSNSYGSLSGAYGLHGHGQGHGLIGGLAGKSTTSGQLESTGEYSAFRESEDFPALPSLTQQSQTQSSKVEGESKAGYNKDLGKYGIGGLMDITKGLDKDLQMLTMGMDLTTFGLNLNSAESLYVSFTSPFSESNPSGNDPQYNIPQCFLMHSLHPPAIKAEHLAKFTLETLFYMFYQLPRDILQALSAQELYRRDWRYHSELKIWLKESANMQFLFFDTKSWDVLALNPAQLRGNIKAGIVPEEEIRVKAPLPNNLAPIVESSNI